VANMIHCRICGTEIGGGLYCPPCNVEYWRRENDDGCQCIRRGDIEDATMCRVHNRKVNDD
jgi:hypothetical protein